MCLRPFTWRKKWEKCWDDVTTCSKSCNRDRKRLPKSNSMVLNSMPPSMPSHISSVEDKEVAEGGIAGEHCEIDDTIDQSGLTFELDSLALEDGSSDDESYDESDELQQTGVKDAKKEEKKAAKKAAKALKRAKREGRSDASVGRKRCDICAKETDLLVRCTVDVSKEWKLVCGKCWNVVSGGVTDGDKDHPHYTYGGLWKNRNKSS